MKINKIIILLIFLILPVTSVFSSSSILDQILDKFEDWDDSYNDALRKKTPEKQSKAINDLTDEILKIVGQSDSVDLKDEIIELREKKADLQRELDCKKESRITAPSDKSFWEVWVKTRDTLDSQIEEISQQISDIDYQIIDKKSEIQELFMEAGVTLSISDIDVITGDSYGNDVLNLLIVGQNIDSILTQYREDIIETQGTYRSISLSLKYYQLYRLSVITQIRAIDISLSHLSEYQNGLTKLINENAKLMNETQQKIRSNDNDRRKIYEANLEGQRIQESVMTDFKSLLADYQKSWESKRKELVEIRDMVQNTIDTVAISDEVSTMIGESLSMINSLNSVQIGEILPFDNTGLERQFEELSLTLSK